MQKIKNCNYMKLILRFTLLLLFCIASVMDGYSFVGQQEIDGIYYELDTKDFTASVTGGGTSATYSGDIIIPSTVEGYGDYQGTYTVTDIGNKAFYGCVDLTSVKFPETLMFIGEDAFWGCSGLMSVEIPSSVKSIGLFAFGYCSGLTVINIPDEVENIEQGAFSGCTGLKSVVIPSSVVFISRDLFRDCAGLESVTLHSGVTYISDNAFRNCTSLTSFHIPASVTGVEQEAFAGCDKLMEISVDSENEKYCSMDGMVVAKDYNALIAVPGGVGRLVVPDGVERIGAAAFSGCTKIRSITIPQSVEKIGEYAFRDCTGVEEILFFNTMETLDIVGISLVDCSALKRLRMPDGLQLREWAFTKDIKKSLTSSGEYNEMISDVLEEISVDKIDHNVGYYLAHDKEDGPYDYVGRGEKKFVQDGITYYYNGSLKRIILRNQETIPDFAFVNFPDVAIEVCGNVTAIGNDAFRNSGIKTISLSGIQELEAGMFEGCTLLESLVLPFPGVGSLSNVSNFGELFGTSEIDGLRAVTQELENGDKKTYYMPANLHKLVLAEGCDMIPYGGLYNCNMLDTLVLPTTLYMVGDKALYGCAKLEDIFCKGADPAVAYDGTFEGVRVNSCKLHVPYNTADIYRRSTGWKDFYYIEEEAPLKITVTKNIENAGVVYGIDEYQPGQTAELKAVANYGYMFEGWIENGIQVTAEDEYSFTVTDSRMLTACFVPVMGENYVDVQPQSSSVMLSFSAVEGATDYMVDIYSDADMTYLVTSITVPASVNTRAADVEAMTVGGLSPESQYYYELTALSADVPTSGEPRILAQFIGAFKTISTTGIDSVGYGDVPVETARYDASGRKVERPVKGLNIVRMSDGTVRKKIVK